MKFKKLLFCIIITFILATIPSLFINTADSYNSLIKPNIYPPTFLFPVIWSILYIIMGISLYLILEEATIIDKSKSLKLFFTQLIVNSLWTVIYFGFNLKLLGIIWIILLILLVILMVREFLNINKLAGYINIPYLIWLVFAFRLSIQIYNLN